MRSSAPPPGPHPGPHPGQPGPHPAPGAATAVAPARKGTLGLIALILAVLGFLFAVIPGAMIVGWLLLPVAFVLALVSFFLRDQKKGLAIAALIVSIVGTIASVIAFVAVIGSAFSEASGGDVTVAPATTTEPTSGATTGMDTAGAAGAGAGAEGTRENPYPLGSTIANNEWSVTVNSFTADATDQVMAENSFNDQPPAGETYAMANITVTRVGAEAQSPMFVTVEYVTSGGNVIASYDNSVVGPDPVSTNDLYAGASASGNVVLQIPEGDQGVLRVSPGMFAEEVFVATS